MIRLARNEAYKSTFFRTRFGAIVEKNGRVLSRGVNYIGHCAIVARPYPESTHAEVSAIAKLLRRRRWDDLVSASLYVARIGRDDVLRLARPCPNCYELISSVGIKRVIYSIDQHTCGVIDVRSNSHTNLRQVSRI